MHRGPQFIVLIIALFFVLLFLAIMVSFTVNFVRYGDFGSLIAGVVFLLFFGLPVVMFTKNIIGIIRRGPDAQKRSAGDGGRRRTDFMTNRTSVSAISARPAPAVRAAKAPLQSKVINGVEWRWPGKKPKARDLQAFCSKCGQALVAANNAASWQADLRCAGCGKSYVSIPGQGPDAGLRTFAQTKQLAERILRARDVRL